jgi:predicted transcriptional regulator
MTTTDTKSEVTPKPHVLRLRVSDDEKAWLERYASQDDRSVHYVLRQALREFYYAHVDETA